MGIFHRYSSEIHGNYRQAYLKGGVAVGALLAAYVLIRLLAGRPMESPVSLVIDAVLLVALLLLTAWYRHGLPEGKITLKEAMLFGMGLALVAGLVYGLLLWAIGATSSTQTVLFTNTMLGENTVDSQNPQLHYWAAWWAIVAGVETIVLGCFGAFLAAIFFRNEKSTPLRSLPREGMRGGGIKSEIKHKQK